MVCINKPFQFESCAYDNPVSTAGLPADLFVGGHCTDFTFDYDQAGGDTWSNMDIAYVANTSSTGSNTDGLNLNIRLVSPSSMRVIHKINGANVSTVVPIPEINGCELNRLYLLWKVNSGPTTADGRYVVAWENAAGCTVVFDSGPVIVSATNQGPVDIFNNGARYAGSTMNAASPINVHINDPTVYRCDQTSPPEELDNLLGLMK